ncbi:MAG: aminopeptidase [Alistipes sp.]
MMKRLFLLCLALFVATVAAMAAPASALQARIASLEGVCEVNKLPAGEFKEKYEVMLTQPLDWKSHSLGTFKQRVIVMHVGYDCPTMVITQGYDAKFALPERYREEISKYFDTNIVFVEHRYFDRSTPEPLDWKYFTAENSAFDLHHIVNVFRGLYPNKWIASGISKGGTTTMLYAAYFPNDVDIYVPYVGPLCTSREDSRFVPFLAHVATPADRAVVEAFQMETFRRKEQLMPGFKTFCEEKGYTFRLPVEEIFDYCVLEYAVSFWQWGRHTEEIPAVTATDEVLLGELLKNAGPDYFSENNAIAPFFVQAARELGYYPYDIKPFLKYSTVRSTKDYLRRIFLPEELRNVKFSKKLYNKVANYLKKNDPRMLFIYGENDPWTAPGAGWVVNSKKQNMRLFVEPGGSHRTRIATLPEAERREVLETLRGWLAN